MNKKKIAINTLFLLPKQVGGTEYLTRSFIKKLEEIDTDNEFIVFCNAENFETFNFSNPRFKKIKLPIFAKNRVTRILFEQLLLPLIAIYHGVDVLHSFGYFGPVFHFGYKHVVTIHDVNWRDHPEDMSLATSLVSKILIELNIKTANRIITDSRFAANRLNYYFPDIVRKVAVIWPGLDQEFLKKESSVVVKEKSPIEEVIQQKYVLCVSAFYPHKNILYLLDLWKALNDPPLLVLVGRNGLDEKKVENTLRKTKKVYHFSQIPLEKLKVLYKHAVAFIFPSIYEGFGFPVYEAAYFGLPTIVGKKELYHPKLQAKLNTLSFNFEEDLAQLKKWLTLDKKLHTSLVVTDYKQAAEDLLKLYQSL